MGGLDHFLAQSLESEIRNNLGKQAVNKIEKRLFEKHGISLAESIEQFPKLDLVLREHFGKGADGIEEKFFKKICSINHKDVKRRKDKTDNPKKWITISDQNLTGIILEALGDADKKKIIASTSEESKIIYDILEESKIAQTSGYRKINSLIEKGILVTDGHIETQEGKKVNMYIAAFQDMRINIIKNEITIDVQVNDKKIDDSSILLAVSEL